MTKTKEEVRKPRVISLPCSISFALFYIDVALKKALKLRKTTPGIIWLYKDVLTTSGNRNVFGAIGRVVSCTGRIYDPDKEKVYDVRATCILFVDTVYGRKPSDKLCWWGCDTVRGKITLIFDDNAVGAPDEFDFRPTVGRELPRYFVPIPKRRGEDPVYPSVFSMVDSLDHSIAN